jgi:hypothetical protein
MRFVTSLAAPTVLRLPSAGPWSRRGWPAGKAATYAHTRSALAFIISELPGERAEALLIAMAALVPTAGEQSTKRPGLRLRVAGQPVRHVG